MASGRRVSGSGSRTLLGVPPSGSPRPPRLSGLPARLPFYVCGWKAACREEAAAHRGSSVKAVGQAQEGPRQAGRARALLRARGSPGGALGAPARGEAGCSLRAVGFSQCLLLPCCPAFSPPRA